MAAEAVGTRAGQPGEFYIVYLGKDRPTEWLFELPRAGLSAGMHFQAEVLDTWNMTVETQVGTGSPTITLKQDKETLTGTYKGQLGETNLKGTIKGKEKSVDFPMSRAQCDK